MPSQNPTKHAPFAKAGHAYQPASVAETLVFRHYAKAAKLGCYVIVWLDSDCSLISNLIISHFDASQLRQQAAEHEAICVVTVGQAM